MLNKIKKLAEDALVLQNKNAMETALREIVNFCDTADIKESVTQATCNLSVAESMAITGGLEGKLVSALFPGVEVAMNARYPDTSSIDEPQSLESYQRSIDFDDQPIATSAKKGGKK